MNIHRRNRLVGAILLLLPALSFLAAVEGLCQDPCAWEKKGTAKSSRLIAPACQCVLPVNPETLETRIVAPSRSCYVPVAPERVWMKPEQEPCAAVRKTRPACYSFRSNGE